MITRKCCKNCFTNRYLQEFINKNHESIGICDYCGSTDIELYPIHKMAKHIIVCLQKAYEFIGDGTGAMWDDEEDEYIDYKGQPSEPVSIRKILISDEAIFTELALKNGILEELL